MWWRRCGSRRGGWGGGGGVGDRDGVGPAPVSGEEEVLGGGAVEVDAPAVMGRFIDNLVSADKRVAAVGTGEMGLLKPIARMSDSIFVNFSWTSPG